MKKMKKRMLQMRKQRKTAGRIPDKWYSFPKKKNGKSSYLNQA